MIRRQAFKFRLEAKPKQRLLMAQFAGCCRLVWNKALAIQKERLERKEKLLNYSESCKLLTVWKTDEQTNFFSQVHSQVLQQAIKNLARAFKDAFDKSSAKTFPQFKNKGKRDSFKYPQGFKLEEGNSKVFLPKIGWVRYRKSRNIIGTPKNITVSKRGDYWYVSIQTEVGVKSAVHPSTSIVGGDLGVVRFLTLSNGEYFKPLNSFKKLATRLAKLQRTLARRVKGSNNWQKVKRQISRLQIRIADARNDYLHKLSHKLSKNHACLVLEELKVANLSKSAKGTEEAPGTNVKAKSGLNRSILDQGWYEFRRQLEYKLDWLGGVLVLVDPKNTSRTCPECGHCAKENRQTQARFQCEVCGYEANADFVGAQNVLRAGHARIACGDILGVSLKAQEPAQLALKLASLWELGIPRPSGGGGCQTDSRGIAAVSLSKL